MMGHNIRFKAVIWKIIPRLFLLPFISGALAKYTGPKGSIGCMTWEDSGLTVWMHIQQRSYSFEVKMVRQCLRVLVQEAVIISPF